LPKELKSFKRNSFQKKNAKTAATAKKKGLAEERNMGKANRKHRTLSGGNAERTRT